MKKLFYIGLILLAVFEIMNVYFIMPMPGSQQSESIDLSYFLYRYRWIFRGISGLFILIGTRATFTDGKAWIPALSIVPVLIIVYVFNFKMKADHMFLEPVTLSFKTKSENTLTDSSIVITVVNGNQAKAYPIRYIQYHHQVRDIVAGQPVMVTYCNVCRTGRVFEPTVNGKAETFRLVGMDHFNAMFEDETTRSWWRQATGDAVTGPLKGKRLREIESAQMTLGKFFTLYPYGHVMQAEERSLENYDTFGRFEKGKSKSDLTKTDTVSWSSKAWVVGVEHDGHTKAFDWNELLKKRVVHDSVGRTPIVLAVASDDNSFVVFQRNPEEVFSIRNDSLISAENKYDFAGRNHNGKTARRINAYQEFWHSWKQFHPATKAYPIQPTQSN